MILSSGVSIYQDNQVLQNLFLMLKSSDLLFLFHVFSAATSMKWIDAKMKVGPITYFVLRINSGRL